MDILLNSQVKIVAAFRSLWWRGGFSIVFSVFLFVLVVPFASAATIVVDNYTDSTPTGNADGNCNLREAIEAMNLASTDLDGVGGNPADADCTADLTNGWGVLDEIQFDGVVIDTTYTLAWTPGPAFPYPLVIDKDLIITGPDTWELSIDGVDDALVFHLGAEGSSGGVDVTMSNLVLENGAGRDTFDNQIGTILGGGSMYIVENSNVTLNNVTHQNNTGYDGGAIYMQDGGTLTITNSLFDTNNADQRGGGIFIENNTTLTIRDSIFDTNTTDVSYGGGIYSSAALTDIRRSTFTGNVIDFNNSGSSAEGGAMYISNQGTNQFILMNSRILNNIATGFFNEVPGVYVDSGSSYVANTEFSGNSATLGLGSALKINRGNGVVINSTISGNSAETAAAGLRIGNGAFTYLINSTIVDNSVTSGSVSGGVGFLTNGSLHIINSVIAGNTSNGSADDCGIYGGATGTVMTSGGYNVIGNNDGCAGFFTSGTGDNIGTTASPVTVVLAALADLGGIGAPVNHPRVRSVGSGETNLWGVVPAATCATTFDSTSYDADGPIVNTTTHTFGSAILTEFGLILPRDQRNAIRPGDTDCEVGAFEDATVYDYGDAPDTYGTLLASSGARHAYDNDLYIGAIPPDSDTNGFTEGTDTSGTANDDDNGETNDEDGVDDPSLTGSAGGNYALNPLVTNNTGSAATLYGWIDFDQSGTFEADEATSYEVLNGTTEAASTLQWTIPNDITSGTSYVRLRLTTDGSITTSTPTGTASDGEVEDEQITITAIDATKPDVTVEQAAGQDDPTNVDSATFTVTFNEPINQASFIVGDITLAGTTGTVTSGPTEIAPNDDTTFQFTVTGMTDGDTVTASLGAGVVEDTSGNTNNASTSTDNQVTYDTTAPTINSIFRQNPLTSPTNATTVTFRVTFSETVVNVDTSDFVLNGTASGTINAVTPVSGLVYDVVITSVSGTGSLDLDVQTGTDDIEDAAGNAYDDAVTTEELYFIDNTGPTVAVEQAAGQNDPTNVDSATFTVTFNEPINPATFVVGDITLAGTTGTVTSGPTEIAPNDDTTFQFTVTGMTDGDTVTASLGVGVVEDVLGNTSAASTSTDNQVTYDSSAFTVTVEQAAGQDDPTNVDSATFTVTFSEPINPATFIAGDITLAGTTGTVTSGPTEIAPNDDTTFQFTVTGMTNGDTVIASMQAGVVEDLATNTNNASTSTDNQVTYSADVTPPDVVINQGPAQDDPTTNLSVTFRAVFDEDIDDATISCADISLADSTAPGVACGSVTEIGGDNRTFDVIVTATGAGVVEADVLAGGVDDLAGNSNNVSTSTDNQVTITVAVEVPTPVTGGSVSNGGGGSGTQNVFQLIDAIEGDGKDNSENAIIDENIDIEIDNVDEEVLEYCLGYDPERPLTFVDAENFVGLEVLKNSYLLDSSDDPQFVMSGYSNTLNEVGQAFAGPQINLVRLEWAKMLMISHCLPVYHYDELPDITMHGDVLEDYADLPRDGSSSRWILDLMYSARYYGILDGNRENSAEPFREVTVAEATKMLVRTREVVKRQESLMQDGEPLLDGLDATAWYYEFMSKALTEGVIPYDWVDSDVLGLSRPRFEFVDVLVDALLLRDMYDESARLQVEGV